MQNLRGAFPEKTEKEITLIARRFYRNFMHNWMEVFMCMTMSKKRVGRMMDVDFSLLKRLYGEGKTVQLICGHQFNWELYNMVMPGNQPFPFLFVYMPLTGRAINRIILYIRGRFGAVTVDATSMKADMKGWINRQYLIFLAADQRPPGPEKGFWLNFLNQPAAIIPGPAKNARQFNNAVVFANPVKTGLGRYRLELELLVEDPSGLSEAEITMIFVRRLEKAVRRQPETYLWTHKRWKHTWKKEYESVWIDKDSRCPVTTPD